MSDEEKFRRLAALALDERGNDSECLAAARKALRYAWDVYAELSRLRRENDELRQRQRAGRRVTSLDDIAREFRTTAAVVSSARGHTRTQETRPPAHASRTITAEPVRSNGKVWVFDELLEVVEERATMYLLRSVSEGWEHYVPKEFVTSIEMEGSGGRYRVSVRYRYAVIAGFTLRSRGRVQDG